MNDVQQTLMELKGMMLDLMGEIQSVKKMLQPVQRQQRTSGTSGAGPQTIYPNPHLDLHYMQPITHQQLHQLYHLQECVMLLDGRVNKLELELGLINTRLDNFKS